MFCIEFWGNKELKKYGDKCGNFPKGFVYDLILLLSRYDVR